MSGCLRFKLDDFSPAQQARIREQLAPRSTIPASSQTRKKNPAPHPLHPTHPPHTKSPYDPDKVELSDYAPKKSEKPDFLVSHGLPNKTEADYNISILNGNGRYEAVILKLPGGNYTPDWMTVDDGIITFHEVKGAFRFGSESRAILAFKSAAAAFPFWRFVWAQKQKNGQWTQKLALNTKSDEPQNHQASSPPLIPVKPITT